MGGSQREGRKAEGKAKWRGERLVAYWGAETWVWWGVVSLGCMRFGEEGGNGCLFVGGEEEEEKGGGRESKKTYTARNPMPGDELAHERDDTGQAFRNGRREA